MLRKDTKATSTHLLHSLPFIREVEMEVVFGTPSKNCSGAGICLIANRFPRHYMVPCPHAPVFIHYVSARELVFRFRKRYLPDTASSAYFRQAFFLVEEPFLIPRRLVRLWNLPAEWIGPGQYVLEEYAQEWRLYFPLEQKPIPIKNQ